MQSASALADEILEMLEQHAKPNAAYDPPFDEPAAQFSSPDAGMLFVAAEELKEGKDPSAVFSSWGSGGYKPLLDSEAKAWHDRLVKAVNERLYVLDTAPRV